MCFKKHPGALTGATGAGKPIHADADGSQNIACNQQTRKAGTVYQVTPTEGEPFEISVTGRDCWALDQLRLAGEAGCTPINNPAPRWSAYIFNLREMGVEIETIREPHHGEYPGSHGRYVLRCRVARIRAGGVE